jgi:hypothetical protein
MNRSFCFMTLVCVAALAAVDTNAYGRGFGGFGGGGFRGGFGGGGFGGGGFRGFGGGGFDRGGFGGGDFNRGGFGGDFDRGGFGGDGGFNRSNFGNDGFGQRESGFRGNDSGDWNRGNFGSGNWSQDANRYGSANRSQVNNFLGLPTDAGLGGATSAFANRGLGSGQALANYGTHPFSQTWAHSQGQNIQNWASNHPEATQAWNNAKGNWAWSPYGVDAGLWAAGAWGAAGWPTLDNWLGWGDSTYYPYDYGELDRPVRQHAAPARCGGQTDAARVLDGGDGQDNSLRHWALQSDEKRVPDPRPHRPQGDRAGHAHSAEKAGQCVQHGSGWFHELTYRSPTDGARRS